MIEFIQDDEKLREERKKAKKNKDKYVGMSSSSMGFRSGGFGSGFESSGGGGSGGSSGWKDDWNNHRSSNPSGFRDHSDEEAGGNSRGASPDVSEYRDCDQDFDYVPPSSHQSDANFSSLPTMSTTRNVTSAASSNASKPNSTRPAKTGIKKPIDLGKTNKYLPKAISRFKRKTLIFQVRRQLLQLQLLVLERIRPKISQICLAPKSLKRSRPKKTFLATPPRAKILLLKTTLIPETAKTQPMPMATLVTLNLHLERVLKLRTMVEMALPISPLHLDQAVEQEQVTQRSLLNPPH